MDPGNSVWGEGNKAWQRVSKKELIFLSRSRTQHWRKAALGHLDRGCPGIGILKMGTLGRGSGEFENNFPPPGMLVMASMY